MDLEHGTSEAVRKDLNQLVLALQSHDRIKSVILFGSTARGTRGEYSDIDLLVLTDSDAAEAASIAVKIRLATLGKLTLPLDLLVENHKEFHVRKVLPTLERKIAREGVVLYAT